MFFSAVIFFFVIVVILVVFEVVEMFLLTEQYIGVVKVRFSFKHVVIIICKIRAYLFALFIPAETISSSGMLPFDANKIKVRIFVSYYIYTHIVPEK